ncbi:MAG: PQQ-binding-like beta-propeller repeat protein, partial [Sedimentisphaerales bacterium]|nr:PQQ-binding-like beta-propeller repeat protein [Sedimentisphaerales bacterium]
IFVLAGNQSHLFAGNGRAVFGINLNNPAEQWVYKSAGIFAKQMPFIIRKSKLIVASTKQIAAVDIKNGNAVWTVKGMFGTSPLAFGDNILAADVGEEKLLVIDSNNGFVVKRIALHDGPTSNSGIYQNNFIYENFYWPDDVNCPQKINEAFESLNLDTGKHNWRTVLGESSIQTQTYFAGDHLFYASQYDANSVVYLSSIDLSSGKLNWKTKLENCNKSLSNMIVDEHSIIIVVDERMYKIDRNVGNIIKTLQLNFTAEHLLRIKNSIICVGYNKINSVNLP